MYYNRLNEAEQIGEHLGRIIIRFKYYSPQKKIAVFSFMFLIIGLPYYFVFYNLMNRESGNLLR